MLRLAMVSTSPVAEAALYIGGWYTFLLALLVYNKWMFGDVGLDFHFPILITACHQVVLCLIAAAILYFRPQLRPQHARANFGQMFVIDAKTYFTQIVPCSVALAADIGLSNVLLKFILLSLYTMLKTLSLVFVLIYGLLFRLEKFNWRLVVIVAVMTVLVAMMGKQPDAGAKHDAVGIVCILVALCMLGLRWLLTQILLKRNHNPYTNTSFSTIFYVLPAMALLLFVVGLFAEGWGEFTAAEVWQDKGVAITLVLMLFPGVLAFAMTYCEFMLLKVAQVLTMLIAGMLKEVLTIVASTVLFGDKLSGLNVVGLVLTLADVLWYNLYRYQVKDSDVDPTPITYVAIDHDDNDHPRLPRPLVEMRRL